MRRPREKLTKPKTRQEALRLISELLNRVTRTQEEESSTYCLLSRGLFLYQNRGRNASVLISYFLNFLFSYSSPGSPESTPNTE